jgi:hypothetical protein
MDVKRFEHLGEEWEAVGTNSNYGPGFSDLPPAERWSLIFRSVSKPERGEYRYRGTLSDADPNAVDESDLRDALEEVLTVAAMDRSRWVWRTAKGISDETTIPIGRVQAILDTTTQTDILQSEEPNPKGEALFTTQDHFVRTASDSNKKYRGVEVSA